MKSKEGKYPVNARVSVDYSKGKPDIRFGYPRKPTDKDVVRQNAGTGIFVIPMLILFVLVPVIILYLPQSFDIVNLTDCDAKINENNGSLINISITCNEENYTIGYYLLPENSKIEIWVFGEAERFYEDHFDGTKDALIGLLKIFGFFFISISWMLFLFKLDKFLARYYTKWKWYQKFQPKFQAWRQGASKKRAYYAKFKKKDIKNNQIEIPLFKNVKLEYKTNGDFSDKLLRLDIIEHDFLEQVRFKKKPDKKSMKQVWLWKTTFTFKDIPTDGYLEVWFK